MPNKSESMSRRKAAKGKTSGGLVDVLSTEDMTKEQLEEQLVRLREELEREREERSFFQLERDEIRSWWEVSRRRLDQTRAQLGRQKDEAERRHLVEINVYKQKLKHVLSEQAAAAAHVKTDGGEVAWLERRRHADDETRRRRRTQDRQADARRRKFSQRKCVQELKLKHQVELMELSNKYDKRVAELESKYFEKTERMRRAESDKTSAAILSLEETMRRRLRSLTDAQRRTFPRAQQFFGDAQSKLARDGKTLKEEASAARTQHARTSVSLEGAQRDNARLFVGLQGAQQNLPDLRRKLEAHERARRQQAAGAAHVKRLQEQLDDVILERDVLVDAFRQVEEERDALLSKQTEVLLWVRQRSHLKEMQLERKMALLSASVDKMEAQILAALDAADASADRLRVRPPDRIARPRPTTSSAFLGFCFSASRLQETLASKADVIRTLQEDLQRRCREYDDLAGSCGRGLDALGVPSSEFPLGAAALVLGPRQR
ncbi:dynein regulatory complex subunit 4-like isoform X5 [Festucalex cinctus]